MTLNQMLYFQTLAVTGHMGHAAEKLFISQPSLSVSMANLEEELGILLFERRGHRLYLTDAGSEFLAHAEKIIRETEEARAHMARLADLHETMIRLGCITPLLRDYFPSNMQKFLSRPENQGVQFELVTENTEELVRRLKNGLYDLLLCSRSDAEGLVQIPVISEPMVLISAEGKAPLASWEEVAANPLIGYVEESATNGFLKQIAEEQHVSFQFRYRGPTEAAIASLVEYGLGYALIPWSDVHLSQYRVIRHPLPSGAYQRNIYLTILQGQQPQGAAARFIRYLTSGDSL